jgi:transposase
MSLTQRKNLTAPSDDRHALLARIACLEARVAALEEQLAQRDSRLAELEAEVQRQGKSYRRRAKRTRPAGRHDRRRRRYRKHPGTRRPLPLLSDDVIHHDVHPPHCPHCGSTALEPTDQFTDHYVEDIPEPTIEVHRYRRHVHRCQACQHTCQARGDLELPGSHIGPRARLLSCYGRAYLGISLGKTATLFRDFFGLTVSRPGVLGHLRWGSALCEPVVQELFRLLRASPVVGADETSWRINGQLAWVWCFSDPRLALFLIDRHRSRAVLERALGKSFAGTLVSDFYAAYHRLDGRKQRCLAHLLRELHDLRAELPWQSVRWFIQPLIDLFQDAIALGQKRGQLRPTAFADAHQELVVRLDHLILETHSRHPACLRIRRRLFWHCDELLTFLDDPRVPATNNGTETDIRGVAAARSDGGVNRSDWGAAAFANLKSIIRTCQKSGYSFFGYGMALVRATLTGSELPLPLDSG